MQKFVNSQLGKSHFLFILVAIVAIGSGVLVQTSTKPPPNLPEFKKAILLPTVKSLGDVNFVDHNDKPFGLDRFKGKWTIVFFGFTNCPDICPTTLLTLAKVKTSLKEVGAWDSYQVIMISVDPERDSPERLKSYVPYFDSEFIGLRAPIDYTSQFAKNLGILIRKGKVLDNGGYDVDHGAALILVNPKGQYAGVLTAPHTQADISSDLISLAKYNGTLSSFEKPKPTAQSATQQQKNEDTSSNNSPALTISDAWIRPAPPTVTTMAAYLKLHNNTDADIIIVEASSPEFDEAMVHQTKVEEGVATMSHMDSLIVPAKSSVELTPMGTHIMLIEADEPLAHGSSATIVLVSNDGQTFTNKVDVKQGPNQETN